MVGNNRKVGNMTDLAKSKRLSKYLEEFTRHCKFKGFSDETILYYFKRIFKFLEFCQKLRVDKIKKDDIVNWNLELRESGKKESYVINNLWVLWSFNKFLREELKLKIKDWFDGLKIPKRKFEEPKYLENDEIRLLLKTIKPLENICELRLRTYIEVMLNTGLRPSEALNLNRDNIVGEETEIIGKGKKERKVYFNDRSLYWVERYLGRRQDSCSALFIRHHHFFEPDRWKLRRAEETFRNHWLKTGIKKEVCLHTLRATYCTNLCQNGCQIEYAQKLLGHASSNTTRKHYLAIMQKHAKKAHFKYLNYED